MHSFSFEAIGTSWTIDFNDHSGKNNFKEVEKEIFSIIDQFDKTYTRFREDSFITEISKKPGNYPLPRDAKPLFDIYQKLYVISQGLFTPTIGNVLIDAGYDANYSLEPKKIRPTLPIEEVFEIKGNTLLVKSECMLDFGAAGKGYLIDIVGSLLQLKGIKSFCIDAGGDILQYGDMIRIGLEHPEDPQKAIGICEIKDQSICASSGNRRKWKNFHHTINPKTLKSPDNVIATWVIAKEAIVADALATALFLDPNPKRYRDFNFEYVILYKDYRAQKSSGFSGELFTK